MVKGTWKAKMLNFRKKMLKKVFIPNVTVNTTERDMVNFFWNYDYTYSSGHSSQNSFKNRFKWQMHHWNDLGLKWAFTINYVTFQIRPPPNLSSSALLCYGLQKWASNRAGTAIWGHPSFQASCWFVASPEHQLYRQCSRWDSSTREPGFPFSAIIFVPGCQ